MTESLLLASFPSNELHTPATAIVLVAVVLLLGVLYVVLRMRSFWLGLAAGAIAAACAAGCLFWPRVLREPRAPNPGPFVVTAGAIAGGVVGSLAGLVGKLRPRRGTSEPPLPDDPSLGEP